MFLKTFFELSLCFSDDSRYWFGGNTFLESSCSLTLHGTLLRNIFFMWRIIINTVLESTAEFRCLIAFSHGLDSTKNISHFVKTSHGVIISKSCHELVSLTILFPVLWRWNFKSNHTYLLFVVLTLHLLYSWVCYWTVCIAVSRHSRAGSW